MTSIKGRNVNPLNPAAAKPLANMVRICKSVCPAIILAKRRIDKLNVRKRYEINSITTIKGSNQIGPPFGTKISRNFKPFHQKPINNKPTLHEKANVNVINKCAVGVNAKGNNPMRLQLSINKKIPKISGINLTARGPACCIRILTTKRYKLSHNICNRVGTSCERNIPTNKTLIIKNTAIRRYKVACVNELSRIGLKKPELIIISSNCSSGDNKDMSYF